METKKLILVGVAALALMGMGCAKGIKQESVMDTPESHYQLGMSYITKAEEAYEDQVKISNLDKAFGEFTRARELAIGQKRDFAPAYEGRGLVYMHWGLMAKARNDSQKAREDFKLAKKDMEEALDKDGKYVPAWIGMGRIITARAEGDWVDDSLGKYKKAIKIDPKSSAAYYYMGGTYKQAYLFSEAEGAYKKVLEINTDLVKEADEQWALVQKIQRAAPGTQVGKQIALIDKISRADIAALFITELEVNKLIEKKLPKEYDTAFKGPEKEEFVTETTVKAEAITDITSHWAKNFIEETVACGVMEVKPDHTFSPNDLITRVNYALMIQKILIAVTKDDGLATRYIGEKSHIADVRSTHFAYNAIMVCVERNIMDLKLDGSFGMSEPVSGADALLIIRKIKSAL